MSKTNEIRKKIRNKCCDLLGLCMEIKELTGVGVGCDYADITHQVDFRLYKSRANSDGHDWWASFYLEPISVRYGAGREDTSKHEEILINLTKVETILKKIPSSKNVDLLIKKLNKIEGTITL